MTFARGLLRAVVTVGGLGWLYLRSDVLEVWRAMLSVPVSAYLACAAWTAIALVAATLRWRILLLDSQPTFDFGVRRLFEITLAANFFGNLLPGVLGGDAARAFAVHRPLRGVGPSVSIVALERGLSFAALLGIAGTLALISEALPPVWAWSLALGGGIALPTLAALGVSLMRTRLCPGSLLPFSKRALAQAYGWSAVSQLATAFALLSVVAALWPETPTWSALAVALIAQLSGVVPAIAGLGPSQAVGSHLLSGIGVPTALATASTLVVWAVAMGFVVAGGLLFLRKGFCIHDSA